jgi:hypothetical protein
MQRWIFAIVSFGSGVALAAPGVQDIVAKNVAARGGANAWHNVQTLSFEGTLDAGGKPSHELPFSLHQKRPHKSRLEIAFKDQTAVQVYDGSAGWKVRPFLNRNEVEPFSAAEARIAAAADELDGPLLDYQSKGTQVALAGTESVDGHPTYKLHLTLKNGMQRNLWVDTGTFLEVKMDGEPRKLDGHVHKVALYFKDYRLEQGLNIAHTQETVVEGIKEPYKMVLTKVAVNAALADTLFVKPHPATTLADSGHR